MKNRLSVLVAFCVTLLVALPTPAHAARFLYELTGDDIIRFEIDTNALTLVPQPDGVIFENVEVEVNSITQFNDIGFVYEFSGGGFSILGTPYDLAGPVLFTGPFSNPTLVAGQFQLVGIDDPDLKFSLAATDLDALGAVPEPQVWLTLLLGFFLVAGLLRADRRKALARAPA